jgi:hypothetical protein
MRRVVRFTNDSPRRASTYASRLLTAAVEIPSSRPALLRLPLLASATKKPSSAGWIPVLIRLLT